MPPISVSRIPSLPVQLKHKLSDRQDACTEGIRPDPSTREYERQCRARVCYKQQ
jgi:hypothetical protein